MKKVRIEDVTDSNIDDLVYVCSASLLDDPIHKTGILLKKEWLQRMLNEYGPCAKIAYYREKPVAQILFYPEEAEPTKIAKRKDVIHLACVYNPFSEVRRLGIGTMLLESLIRDCRGGLKCLRGKRCRFIVTKAFNTGEALPLADFYRRKGFKPSPLDEPEVFYFSITKPYEPGEPSESYEPLPEDKEKAIIFFGPACQFSYDFAVRVSRIIREISPKIPIEMVNSWEKPEESVKRKNWWLIVNAKPIHTFFMEEEKFRTEVRNAIGNE